MTKFLITGIDGFTGYHLAKVLLDRGYEVAGFGLKDHLDYGMPITYRQADLLDTDGLADLVDGIQPDKVFHLAGVSHVMASPELVYKVNIVGTRNLLSALATKSCPSFVMLASSANIYGNAEGILDESVFPSPCNDYAVSKYGMELMANIWRDKLPITIVRPFNYTGIGQPESFVIPKIVKHFRERLPILELGNIDVVREFNDVRDVVKAYVSLSEIKVDWGPFNICSGKGYTLKTIMTELEKLCCYLPEIRINPAFVRSNEVTKLVGCADALQAVIGNVFKTDINETLSWMLKSKF